MAVEIFCLIFKLFVIVFLIFLTIDVQFSVEQCFSVYGLSTLFCFAVRVWEWECKSPSPVISSSGVETTGTGGVHCTPKFRTCTPCAPQVKDAAYVKILSKRL